ncbi:hypothetical protein GJ496_001512, partial [Pomphorhynchus laevis]
IENASKPKLTPSALFSDDIDDVQSRCCALTTVKGIIERFVLSTVFKIQIIRETINLPQIKNFQDIQVSDCRTALKWIFDEISAIVVMFGYICGDDFHHDEDYIPRSRNEIAAVSDYIYSFTNIWGKDRNLRRIGAIGDDEDDVGSSANNAKYAKSLQAANDFEQLRVDLKAFHQKCVHTMKSKSTKAKRNKHKKQVDTVHDAINALTLL